MTSTEHKRVPTSKVVCHTYPSYYWTESMYATESTSLCPSSYVESSACPKTTNSPSAYVTKTPCPETYKSKSETVVTSVYTETGSKCAPASSCATHTMTWGNGKWNKEGGGW